MVNFIRPLEPVDDAPEVPRKSKKKPLNTKESEEIGFIVRREHRRKHRQDREI